MNKIFKRTLGWAILFNIIPVIFSIIDAVRPNSIIKLFDLNAYCMGVTANIMIASAFLIFWLIYWCFDLEK